MCFQFDQDTFKHADGQKAAAAACRAQYLQQTGGGAIRSKRTTAVYRHSGQRLTETKRKDDDDKAKKEKTKTENGRKRKKNK